MNNTRIRDCQEEDTTATARVFFDSVRIGARKYYDDVQRRAWAPEVPDTAEWHERFRTQTVKVAEQNGSIVGFMTLTDDGYIDLAFVAPHVIGQGVAKALYDSLRTVALAHGLTRLHAEASLMARPFFERQGWSVLEEEVVIRDGVELTRFKMELALT